MSKPACVSARRRVICTNERMLGSLRGECRSLLAVESEGFPILPFHLLATRTVPPHRTRPSNGIDSTVAALKLVIGRRLLDDR